MTTKRVASTPKLATVCSVNVSVSDIREKSKRYTAYKVEMAFGDRNVVIFRRYNEFLAFYDKLKKQSPELLSSVQQKLPPKKLFKKVDPETLQVRQAALKDLVTALVSIPALFGQ
jgi:hypothetical protein